MIETRKDLLLFHEALCQEARDLMDKKNRDYSGASVEEDPFFNFRRVVDEGIVRDLATSVYIRFSDKVARISTLLSREAAVTDEKLRDTIVDGINYLVLLLAVRGDGDRESAQEAGAKGAEERDEAEAPGHHLEGEADPGHGVQQAGVSRRGSSHKEGSWQCWWCDAAFHSLEAMEEHRRFMHGPNLFPV